MKGARLLLICVALLLPSPLRAEEVKILTIRPERLASIGGIQTGKANPGRDPFNWTLEQINLLRSKEPRAQANATAGLVLTGIIWDDRNPLAVINNLMVARGEMINDLLVVDITKNMVIFEQNGIRHKLWLDSPLKILPARKK